MPPAATDTAAKPTPPATTPITPTPPPQFGLGRFLMDFDKHNDQNQAIILFKLVSRLIDNYEYQYIGLTYSANRDQTINIRTAQDQPPDNKTGYFKKGSGLSKISGDNQAAVLQLLSNKINKSSPQIQEKFNNHFRIIPFTTMGGVKNRGPLNKNDMTECIDYLENFIPSNSNPSNRILLGWVNQYTKPGRFAIGGGVAKGLPVAEGVNVNDYQEPLQERVNPLVTKFIKKLLIAPNSISSKTSSSSRSTRSSRSKSSSRSTSSSSSSISSRSRRRSSKSSKKQQHRQQHHQ